MKLSDDRQINFVTLLSILIGVGLLLALMGVSSAVIILLLIGTFFIVYLVYPRIEKNAQSFTHEVQSEKPGFASLNEPILTQEHLKQLTDRWALLGEKTAVCPSCQALLPKFPVRKSTCKACKQSIHRGQNPLTKEYLLYNDKQEPLFIELLWMSNGVWKTWFNDFNEIDVIRCDLAKVYKCDDPLTVPFNDVIWAKIQRNFEVFMSTGQWYNYLLELETGIRFLDEEQRNQAALPLIYQYIYLACNVTSVTGTEYEGISVIPPSIGQVYLIERSIKDLENFDELYLDFMTKSDIPRFFNGTVIQSLTQYKKERDEYYKSLANSSHGL